MDLASVEPPFGKEITHLVCNSFSLDTSRVHRIAGQKPGLLAHISIQQRIHTIPGFIQSEPTPYQNLQHFGTLQFSIATVFSS